MTKSIMHTRTGTTYGTSLTGGATTRTQLGDDLSIPTWTRFVDSIITQAGQDALTAAESAIVAFDLDSPDGLGIKPYKVLGAPIGAIQGTVGSSFAPRNEKYPVNLPVQAGQHVQVFAQSLAQNTNAIMAGAGLVITDEPPGLPQVHAQIGTKTSTGTTTNSNVAGTAYTITGGSQIREVCGIVAPTTIAAADGILGMISFVSNEFRKATLLELPIQPISGGLSTTTQAQIDGVAREEVVVEIASPCTIQDYFNMAFAPGTAGNFVSGVLFI